MSVAKIVSLVIYYIKTANQNRIHSTRMVFPQIILEDLKKSRGIYKQPLWKVRDDDFTHAIFW